MKVTKTKVEYVKAISFTVELNTPEEIKAFKALVRMAERQFMVEAAEVTDESKLIMGMIDTLYKNI